MVTGTTVSTWKSCAIVAHLITSDRFREEMSTDCEQRGEPSVQL